MLLTTALLRPVRPPEMTLAVGFVVGLVLLALPLVSTLLLQDSQLIKLVNYFDLTAQSTRRSQI